MKKILLVVGLLWLGVSAKASAQSLARFSVTLSPTTGYDVAVSTNADCYIVFQNTNSIDATVTVRSNRAGTVDTVQIAAQNIAVLWFTYMKDTHGTVTLLPSSAGIKGAGDCRQKDQ